MMLRTWLRRVATTGLAVALAGTGAAVVTAEPAAAATTPHISASVVNGNAGKIKVTGSNFAKKASVTVEFDQNGAPSGDEFQTFNVTSDKNGKISLTASVFVTAACLVGVVAWDAKHTSNSVDLNTTGKGCTGATLTIDPCRPICSDFYVSGTGFTPGGQLEVDFFDGTTGAFMFSEPADACGTLAPGSYPPAPAGQILAFGACNGFTEHSDSFCHRASVEVTAEDFDTDYVTPPLFINPRC